MKTQVPSAQILLRFQKSIDLQKYVDLRNIMTFWCSKRDIPPSVFFFKTSSRPETNKIMSGNIQSSRWKFKRTIAIRDFREKVFQM